MIVDLPPGLEWWRDQPAGAAWLERLPRLVSECADEWSLRLGAPFEPATISLVVPATRPDGSAAVLKLVFPEPESSEEPDALAAWDGRGAVRLLARDEARSALLMERCLPGSQLWEEPDDERANEIAAGVLRRLWRPAPAEHPFRWLADASAEWGQSIPADWERLGRPFERSLVDRALGEIRELAASQPETVILHQDLHGGNLLAAEREPWLAIDPKPLVGERAFDLASLLRDRRGELERDPRPVQTMTRRLDLLSEALVIDRERMRGWGIVHALAWGLGETVLGDMVACARWLAVAR
ncbi:MAG TPA: aminoglycoside phosphotransferase family protein [Gaiellaceae bacterium]|nr:aminoglycoside phosphotransferase family protein [Gaiellaceae bacterium]